MGLFHPIMTPIGIVSICVFSLVTGFFEHFMVLFQTLTGSKNLVILTELKYSRK